MHEQALSVSISDSEGLTPKFQSSGEWRQLHEEKEEKRVRGI
jgi:hypothetical protein